jgi:hypothetical protein
VCGTVYMYLNTVRSHTHSHTYTHTHTQTHTHTHTHTHGCARAHTHTGLATKCRLILDDYRSYGYKFPKSVQIPKSRYKFPKVSTNSQKSVTWYPATYDYLLPIIYYCHLLLPITTTIYYFHLLLPFTTTIYYLTNNQA